MKRLLSLGLIVFPILISFLIINPVRASVWEWLTDLHGYFGVTVPSNATIKIYYDVNTSGNFYEFRNAYYYVTTTPDSVWTPPANWTQWSEYTATTTPYCRKQGNVNGTINDESCFPNTPTVFVTSTLWTRVTTNYQGCGTWTPTPDTTNCGDYVQATSTITP